MRIFDGLRVWISDLEHRSQCEDLKDGRIQVRFGIPFSRCSNPERSEREMIISDAVFRLEGIFTRKAY